MSFAGCTVIQPPPDFTNPPSAADVTFKGLAHRARTYAAVPEDQFEQLLSDKRRREVVNDEKD